MATKVLFRAEDLLDMQSHLGRRLELIEGDLHEVTTSGRHGEVVIEIGGLLRAWNKTARGGRIMTDVGVTLGRSPDTVRAPDVSFYRKGRLADVDTRHGFAEVAPDLAIEVRSPNDTWAELRRKAEQFMARGTELVLIVEPDRVAEVLRAGQPPRRLHLEDVFEAPEILPGFSCRVSDFFPEEL